MRCASLTYRCGFYPQISTAAEVIQRPLHLRILRNSMPAQRAFSRATEVARQVFAIFIKPLRRSLVSRFFRRLLRR